MYMYMLVSVFTIFICMRLYAEFVDFFFCLFLFIGIRSSAEHEKRKISEVKRRRENMKKKLYMKDEARVVSNEKSNRKVWKLNGERNWTKSLVWIFVHNDVLDFIAIFRKHYHHYVRVMLSRVFRSFHRLSLSRFSICFFFAFSFCATFINSNRPIP